MTKKPEYLVHMIVLSFDTRAEAESYAHSLSETFASMPESAALMCEIRWGEFEKKAEVTYVH